MKRSTHVAAPLLASAALALLIARPPHASRSQRIDSMPAPPTAQTIDAEFSFGRSTQTVQRSGFGSWFLVAAIAGLTIAFAVGE